MSNIRRIFLSPSPNFALMQAADLLGMTFAELKREIANGAIVAVSTRLGQRVTKEEMIAAAMRIWEQGVIEEALGDEAAHAEELMGRVAGSEVAMGWGW